MTYQEFQYKFHTLPKADPRMRELCDRYPHYKRATLDRAWAQIQKIRARKQDKI